MSKFRRVLQLRYDRTVKGGVSRRGRANASVSMGLFQKKERDLSHLKLDYPQDKQIRAGRRRASQHIADVVANRSVRQGVAGIAALTIITLESATDLFELLARESLHRFLGDVELLFHDSRLGKGSTLGGVYAEA